MTSPLSPATTGASADGARPVPPLVVLIGPTASGKSSLAIQLARSLDASGHPAEIVNGDSMAIYAGMDIGTAKPSASDRALVPHHLVDVLEVTQTSTVADFQQLAREVIARLRSSGRIPILVGDRPCTCERSSTTSSSPGPIRRCAPGGSASWPPTALPHCTRSWFVAPRPGERSSPRTAGASCVRWRCWNSPATTVRTCRHPITCSSMCINSDWWSIGRRWTAGSRSGCTPCSMRGWSTRCAAWRAGDCVGGHCRQGPGLSAGAGNARRPTRPAGRHPGHDRRHAQIRAQATRLVPT